ncbi:hypothetical protein PVAND_007731 [Polypedilum vanderplanki]|uniref:Uncharacterized protein n=1 Tax=Polypedilum vanderplanki TaxID=319348 RepID=A0A9J6C7U9_POLVA|nr:hypothetical protein PVAND_007731 [Polypedilum vanderplanki]
MEKSPKKWSLGNILFRKSKKDIPQADFSSEEDDFKAGFGSEFITKKSPAKLKNGKPSIQSFDHHQQQYSVANPEFHFYKPSPQSQSYQQQQQYQRPNPQVYQNNLEYINNQINLEKTRATTLSPQYIYNTNNNYLQYQGSSQDEKSSYNSLSSPINKSSSENGSRTSLNKKTRSARNERYYQRIMRDDGRPLTVYSSVNSIENNQKYQLPLNGNNRLSASLKSSSICSSDFMPTSNQIPMSQSQNLPVTRGVVFRGNGDVDGDKDDYENIHQVDESAPPPIPPRDPNRRFSINSASVSQNPYYFDHALQKYVIFNMNAKCYSDDKLWKNEVVERPKSARAVTMTDRQDKQQQQQHDILKPRSRKPLNVHTNLDNECVFSSEDVVDNPRFPISQRSKSAVDFEKMMALNESNQIRNKYYAHKQRNLTSVEPIKYQPQQQQQQRHASEELQALRKKYSSAEDVNRNKVNMRQKLPTTFSSNNTPGTRKSLNEMDLKAKESAVSANLDDAINELELMYKNLVKDENLMERASRRDLPTPTKFTQLMRKYEEYENEENRNDKEPDIVLDDVFSRNLKHANQKLKVLEQQPPFGIPNKHLYPIPPKPSQDYLSVEPPPAVSRKAQIAATQNNPDIVADDLAVRNLRKDNPNYSRRRNLIEIDNNHFMKRNHTLSSLSDLIYNDILKDSTKASGGILEKYSQYEIPNKKDEEKDVKSKLYLVNKGNSNNNNNKSEREDFEKSLNELVIESKAISQKLEKDLSKLKRESVTPKPIVTTAQSQPKTLVNLLTYRKSVEREKEKTTSTSCSPIKSLQSTEPERPQMTSTACSPIKDIQDICPPKEEIIKSQALKQQKTEKIENLIKMFNTTTLSSPEPAKKAILIEKPSRKLSDLSNMFEKTHSEIDTKPPTQPISMARAEVKKTLSNSSIEEKKLINPRIVSPTVMNPQSKASPSTSKVVITQKVMTTTPIESTGNNAIKTDVESNINNIKELIQQIKLTEFEKNAAMKPDILKSAQSDLPDYDNIKDDYEMTDCGKLERVAFKPTVIQATLVIKPDFEQQHQSPEIENDENSVEVKSISTTATTSTTSSSVRETSVESSSKSSIEPIVVNNNKADDSAAIYKDAIEFLQENVDQKAVESNENDHKSPITSIRQNKEVVLNYIDKINENLENVKSTDEQHQKQMSVKESVCKLEDKISLSRQNSEATSVSDTSQYNTPSKEPSTPTQIKPVVLPKVGPSDTESLYNSSEELSMIFGNNGEQQQQQNVPMHPGKIIEEDFEAEFEKIAHDEEILDDKVLDENFNVTLIDINNNSEYVECFDNELSDITNDSAMSNASIKSTEELCAASSSTAKSDDNNNILTNDLSKPNNNNAECFNKLLNRKPNLIPSTSNHNNNNSNNNNSSSTRKSKDNSSCTSTAARSQQQQPLKTQCILLACVYCIMLYLQFIIYNFKQSS